MAIKILETVEADNYVKIKLNHKDEEFKSVLNWCKLSECGKQVNIHSIAFKNQEELMMFKLRWS